MTPWELIKKSEHSHQRALFAWANCAALYGFGPAWVAETYALKTRDECLRDLQAGYAAAGQLGMMAPVPDLSRLFAIHNQGHGDKIRGAMAKAEGVKKGVGDMMWPRPVGGYHGLFIELKRPKHGKAAAGTESEEQVDWRTYLTRQGYKCVVAVGWEEAAKAIQRYWG